MSIVTGALRNVRDVARDPRSWWQRSKGNIELWANLIVLGWALVFMLWRGGGFAITVGSVFAIWAILAVSLNLVVGYAGLLSVGHIGFPRHRRLHDGRADLPRVI